MGAKGVSYNNLSAKSVKIYYHKSGHDLHLSSTVIGQGNWTNGIYKSSKWIRVGDNGQFWELSPP